MEIVNDTPLPAAFLVGKIAPPHSSLTMIVKGTFDLRAGEAATASEEMLFPTGDEPYPDDPDATGGPRYPSDFCPTKPRADLLLAGSCHVPDGRPRPHCQVRFEVGSRGRVLDVRGDREWRWTWLGRRATGAVPFEKMELRYERAFGGRGWKPNPVGAGFRKETGPDGERMRALPNVEDPAKPVRSTRSRPEPAGFGPLGSTWKERRSKAGTYGRAWRRERWPWFPEDFDPTYFNAAPTALQVPYLQGDESLLLENLHPEHALFEARLPKLRVRSFLCDREPGETDSGFREAPMHLDTVWVDADALQLVLVWRGHLDVATEDHEDIAYAYVRMESLDAASPDLAECEQLLVRRLEEQAAEEEPPEPRESLPRKDIRPEIEELAARETETLRLQLAEVGVDLDAEQEPTEEARAEEQQMRERYGIDAPRPGRLGRDEVLRLAAEGVSLAEADLRGLDLSEASLHGADLRSAILTGANLTNTDLAAAQLEAAALGKAILKGAKLQGAQLANTDLSRADLTGADLTQASACEASFDRSRLDRAILTGIEATDATFAEASLVDAILQDGQFEGADFSECVLDGARFEGAVLREASLEGARGTGIVLDGADLTELRAADCDFPGGSLREVKGPDSVWEGARLEGADFSYAILDGADLSSANLREVTFRAASLKQARLERASLSGAVAPECNLFQASLEATDLTGADLRGANVYGADLVGARLDEAQFLGANLKQTRRDP